MKSDVLRSTVKKEVVRFSFFSRCVWLIFVFALLFPSHVVAEDLMFFYTGALEHNPGIKGAAYENEASRDVLKQAYAKLLPEISAEGKHINNRDEIVSSDNTVFGKGATSYQTDNYTLSLVQPVFNYPSIVGVSKAKEKLRLSDVEYALEKQKLILKVTELYFNVLSERDNHEFARAEQAAVKEHFELTKGRHSMGLAPVTDLLDARARLVNVVADTIDAGNRLDDALQALYEASGKLAKEPAGLKEELPLEVPDPGSAEGWIALALKRNLEIRTMQHRVEVARQEVRRLRADHYPVVAMEARHNWNDTEGSLFGGGSEVEKDELILTVNVPVFKGGLIRSQVAQAKKLYQASRERLREQELAVKRETRAAYLGVISAISRAEALAQSVAAQKMAVEAKREGFKSGLYTSLVVLDAERDYYFAQRDYAGARYDYILNRLRLEQAAERLTADNLHEINGLLEGY